MKTTRKFLVFAGGMLAAAIFFPMAVADCAAPRVRAEQKEASFDIMPLPAEDCQTALNEAYELLAEARRTSSGLRDPGNEFYVQAITKLQELLKEYPDSVEGLFLMSHAYRLRGSGAYAQDYYKKALSALAEKMADDDGNQLFNMLTLAIFYTAGDIRYTPDGVRYAAEGKSIAAQVKTGFANLKSNLGVKADKSALARILMAEAAASAITGDNGSAAVLLAKAAHLPLDAGELEATQNFVELHRLASSGQWLWEVAPNTAMGEYLIRYAIDTGRFIRFLKF